MLQQTGEFLGCVNIRFDFFSKKPFAEQHTKNNMIYINLPEFDHTTRKFRKDSQGLRQTYCVSLRPEIVAHLKKYNIDDKMILVPITGGIAIYMPLKTFNSIVEKLYTTDHVITVTAMKPWAYADEHDSFDQFVIQ
jgi:hypothetical protein